MYYLETRYQYDKQRKEIIFYLQYIYMDSLFVDSITNI